MIWNPFRKKVSSVLGIDIGTSSVKVVELSKKGKFPTLVNYGEIAEGRAGKALYASFAKFPEKDIADILSRILQTTGVKARQAAVGIPLFSSFSTIIDLPAMSSQELGQAVRYEARKYVPVPMGEIELDWLRLEHLSSQKTLRILIVAVPREALAKYRRIGKRTGLEIRFMEPETFSLARALLPDGAEPAMIIDIGARSTIITIAEKRIAAIHHNLELSGVSLTRTLAQALGIDSQRAERIKREKGLRGDPQVLDILAPHLNRIYTEAGKIMENYVNKGGGRPAKVILTGGSALMPGLLAHTEKTMRIKAERGDPFLNIETPAVLDDTLRRRGPSFATAVGLALRGL